jgi:hypothetical protein
MPVTYPGGSQRITVEAFLKQPRIQARALTDLTSKRFAADKVLMHAGSDSVASGAAVYQRSESIYPDRDPLEVGVRAEYPRTGWTEALLTALVHKYGLEVPISDEARRRNAFDQVLRAQRKIANGIVKFVDTKAMTMLTTDTGVNTDTSNVDWSTAGTDIIADIAGWRKVIYDQDEGYDPNTLIVNPAQELDLIVDSDIRDALPREGATPNPAVITGRAVPILGLTQIVVTPALTAGTVVLMDSTIAGSIADETPAADEGYSGFNPGAPYPTVWVKTYRNNRVDETIVRGVRFPAMWLGEPKAVLVATGV